MVVEHPQEVETISDPFALKEAQNSIPGGELIDGSTRLMVIATEIWAKLCIQLIYRKLR